MDLTYDDLHRVTQVTDSAPYSIAYTYDEVGNRVLRVSSTTNAGAPIAVTDTAVFSSQTEAVLSAAVNPNGASTMAWMEWGTDTNYGNTTTHQPVGSGNLTVNTIGPIAGLSLATTYHFRVVAQNAIGIAYGEDETFKTIDLNFTYTTGSEVPITVNGFTATGKTISLSLNYAPPTGTELMVVKNTGLGFINGTFNGLAQGQVVDLGFGGKIYNFIANYYGGSGNDLVLVWANSRPFAWGRNFYGQIGDNTTIQRNLPVPVTTSGVLSGKTVLAVAGSNKHSLALCSDGTLAAWGRNAEGQLGDSTTIDRVIPVSVITAGTPLAGKTVVAIAAGLYHSIALCSDGTMAAWGYNGWGTLGDGTTISRSIPAGVITAGTPLAGRTAVAISCGQLHNLVLCSDGTMVAWGYNSSGELGDNSTTDRYAPVAVATTGTILAGKTVAAVSAGTWHNLALCSDGTLVSWGANWSGQLGDNSTTDRRVPTAVSTTGTALAGKSISAIVAGFTHSEALCSDGTLAAWGDNFYGGLGDNSTATRYSAVAVTIAGTPLAGKNVIAIAAGQFFNVALCSDSTVVSWGYNSDGALGDNSTTDRHMPVAVDETPLTGGEQFIGLFKGSLARHTLALVSSPQYLSPEITVYDGNGIAGTQRQNNTRGFGFPDTPVGASSLSQTFTIRNTGMADLTGIVITKASFGDPGDFSVGSLGTSTLAPGALATFTVTFSPTAVGRRSAILQIASSDSDENPFVIPLFGNGPAAMVVEQPEGTGLNDGVRTISFGSVLSGSFGSLTFTIKNAGEGDLTGLDISFDGINAADFEITASPTSPLIAGNSATFTVRFSPTSLGPKSATLHIASNDAGATPFDINLAGIAVSATPVTATGTGTKTTGNIFPAGDVDYYFFTAQAGDRVYAAVTTSFAAGSQDSELRIVGLDGTTVLEYDDDDGELGPTSSSIAGLVMPATGTYYARVNCKSATSILCPYDLHLRVHSGMPTPETEPNAYPAGQALPPGGWVSGNLSAASDVDYYSLSLTAGDTVFLSLDLDPERDGVTWNGVLGLASFGNPQLYLYVDDVGVSSPNSEASVITVKDTGTYYVRVEAKAGDSTFGTYHLSVSVVPATVKPSTTYTSTDVPKTIPDGPSVVGSTIVVPDSKRIGKLKVFLNLTHANMPDLDVSLTAPDGNTVGLFTDIGSSTQTTMNLGLDDDAGVVVNYYSVKSGIIFKPESGWDPLESTCRHASLSIL